MIQCDHSRDYKWPVHCNTCVPPMFKPKRKIADVEYHHCDLYKQWIPCYFYPCCICNTSIVMSGNNVQILSTVFACPFLEVNVNIFFWSFLGFFLETFWSLCSLLSQNAANHPFKRQTIANIGHNSSLCKCFAEISSMKSWHLCIVTLNQKYR